MKFVPFDDVIAQLEAINDTDENPSQPLFWEEVGSYDMRRPAGEMFDVLRSARRAGAFRSPHLQGLEDAIKFTGTEDGLLNLFDYIHKATGDNLMAEKRGQPVLRRLIEALRQLNRYGDITAEVHPSLPRKNQRLLRTYRVIAAMADAKWPTHLNRHDWLREVAGDAATKLQRGAISTKTIHRRLNEMIAMPLYRDRPWLAHAKSVGARSGHGGDEDAPLSTEIERHAVANRRGQRTDSMAHLRR